VRFDLKKINEIASKQSSISFRSEMGFQLQKIWTPKWVLIVLGSMLYTRKYQNLGQRELGYIELKKLKAWFNKDAQNY
jgi:hypothetical protein